MSPDRACHPIEWHFAKPQLLTDRLDQPIERTVRSANLKGNTNHHTQTHPSHQRKKQSTWKNQPIEPAGRSNGTFERTLTQSNSPLDRTAVRSNGLSDPASTVHFFRITHCIVIELFRLTYSQCSFQSTTNHCEYTRSLFAFSTFGCYIRNLSNSQTTQTIWTLTYLHVLLV